MTSSIASMHLPAMELPQARRSPFRSFSGRSKQLVNEAAQSQIVGLLQCKRFGTLRFLAFLILHHCRNLHLGRSQADQ